MLVKTAIVGAPEFCEKCGHCHDLDSPCLKSISIEEDNKDSNLEKDLVVGEKES